MGDRALIQFVSWPSSDPSLIKKRCEVQDGSYSPVVYLHWMGEDVPRLLSALQILMGDRRGDVDYTAARCIGLACQKTPGNLSVGVFNSGNRVWWGQGDTHGDAGVILVNVHPNHWFETHCEGGYMTPELIKEGIVHGIA
jgi:hypothetical protein